MRGAAAVETAGVFAVTTSERREEALRRLARQGARRGYRIAYDLLGSRADAEDAVQEALVRAADSFEKLRDPEALDGWFLRVLTNLCLRMLRRRRLGRMFRSFLGSEVEPARRPGAGDAGGPTLETVDLAPRADDALGRARDVRALLVAVEALPPMQRTTVVLRYGHELGVPEIGELLGISAGTVKTHLVRGLERLRGHLGCADGPEGAPTAEES